MKRCHEFRAVAVFAGIARNSRSEMTASCCSEHIREGDGSLCVPGGSGKEEIFSDTELIDEPDHHEAIAPVGHEWGTSHGFLAATLRICAAEQTLGLPIGDLDTPAVAESLDGLCIGSRGVSVEEDRVRVLAAGSRTITMDKGSFPAALYQIASNWCTDTMVS